MLGLTGWRRPGARVQGHVQTEPGATPRIRTRSALHLDRNRRPAPQLGTGKAARAEREKQQANRPGAARRDRPDRRPQSAADCDHLRRRAGWKQVEYKGDGVYRVSFEVTGRLNHDFTFPTIQKRLPDGQPVRHRDPPRRWRGAGRTRPIWSGHPWRFSPMGCWPRGAPQCGGDTRRPSGEAPPCTVLLATPMRPAAWIAEAWNGRSARACCRAGCVIKLGNSSSRTWPKPRIQPLPRQHPSPSAALPRGTGKPV